MRIRNTIVASVLVLGMGLAAGIGTASAETAKHHGHQAAKLALTMNAGAKWQGDGNMIKGMDGIRGAIVSRLPAIHNRTLPVDDYRALATEVQSQVDFMVANCKLAPEVDEQFHLVLEEVLEGISQLQAGPDHRAGAVRIVTALNAYGNHFEHPNWQAIK